MDKIIYNISSFNRAESLIKTVESIYHQSDVINITLNSYDEIPIELYDKKIKLFLSDNEKGDAYKFYNLINSNGYYLTIDDDLIYDKNYSQFMIDKIEEYNRKSIITIHGRNFQSFPINSYYSRTATVYHFRNEMVADEKVQFGGTGVMGFHTDLFKINMDYFKYPNMADVWIGKYAKENDIQIICAKHDKDFVKQQAFGDSIYSSDLKNDVKQTKLVNDCYNKSKISIIIPTFNNVEYIDECLQSIVESSKDYSYEVLVGIDHCEKTLSYIKNNKFYGNIRFFYFQKNVGPYVIKNTLAKLSNCDILLFFDSDDIMKENMVKDCINLLSVYNMVKPMYHNFSGSLNKSEKKYEKSSGLWGEGVFAIKKSIFMHYNGFEDWRCAADSDFMARIYKNGISLQNSKNLHFYRRIHSKGLTSDPLTNYQSELRRKYVVLSKNKKNFGPLPTLVTSSFVELEKLNSIQYNTVIEPSVSNKQKVLDFLIKPKISEIDKTTISQKRKEDIQNKENIIKTNNSNLKTKKINFGSFTHPTRKK